MWLVIVGSIIFLYLLNNYVIPTSFDGILGTYIIRPLLWCILAVFVIFIANHEQVRIWKFNRIRRWTIGRSPLDAAILLGGFQVSMLIIAGLFFGFGVSPYSHSFFGIIMNLFLIASAIFAVELSRSYLIKKNATRNHSLTLVLFAVTMLFVIIQIDPSQFSILSFSDPQLAVKFIGETIIPLIAIGLFASYLAYIGGAAPAIIYMLLITGFEWFSPILPDIDWALSALINTIAPAIGFLILQNSIEETTKGPKRKRESHHDPMLGWTGVAMISLFLVFFSFGFFGVEPTVISSGSMQPALDVGDIVIISELDIDSLKVGDIIQYRQANISIPIVHRIDEIKTEEGVTLFFTKGDANNNRDMEPVRANQIMGKALFNIPKIGWIPLMVKQLFQPNGNSVIN